MRLLYIANSRFPSERAHMAQIVHTCAALHDAGAEVTLAVTDRPTEIAEGPEEYYGRKLPFRIERLHVPDLAGRFGHWPRLLSAVLYTWQRFLFARETFKYISQHPHDIVYGRDEWILWFLSWRVEAKCLIYESHEAKKNFAAKRLLSLHVKCVVISEGIRDVYLSLSVPERQLLVAHDAIDDSFFGRVESATEARRRLRLSRETRFIAMYIGGFEHWKGIDTFCQTAALLPHVAFAVIGGKAMEVEAYRKRYPDIKFIGARPYKELPNNQQAADVLVVPNSGTSAASRDYTSPLKLFAHLASRVPLILSDTPSLRRVAGEDVATFFTADQPSALALAIEKVLSDRAAAKEKAERAFLLGRRFTWDARAKAILNFIQ